MFTSILQALISVILCPGEWKFTGLLFSIPHTKTSQISYYFLFFLYTEIGMQTTEIHTPQLFLVIIVVQIFVEAALGFLLLI